LPIPPELQARFQEKLGKKEIPNGLHGVQNTHTIRIRTLKEAKSLLASG
jgi:hypothetical protein